MRLSAIKLAGFKSFVDPTTFQAPTNLTGIVGPNGCGKSNIIDGVRWVMGEGSAKVLRGESMADVIFSGSSTRKPVGTATVELIFDNTEGRIAGQFAGYNEISVKRQVSRDGVSVYYLNGTRCRRKDVRDLFLGTGLGSRSYSIIEQGMISEIVDARPEEIRAHLEEAAGISKYKERRRETERRIQHTRDNLSRLADLRDEVGKHLSRLKRQARAAVRYRKFKQEKRELESRLMTLQWKDLMSQADKGKQDLAKRETALQESIALQRAAEAALEKLHQDQGQASESFNEVQGELYAVGSDIARLEQTIQHARELQERQKTEFEETEAALQDLEKHKVLDKAQVEQLTRALAEVEPALAAARKSEDAASEEMAQAESAVAEWQKQFEQHHLKSTDSNREGDQARSRIEVLDQRLLQAAQRIEALDLEAGSINTSGMQGELDSLEKESQVLAKQERAQQQELDKLRKEIEKMQTGLRSAEERFGSVQRDLHTREGRLQSLEALQQAALEDRDGEQWLRAQGLSDAPRLAKAIKVESGWEAAVEVALGHWLQSVLVGQDSHYDRALDGLENTSLDFIENRSGGVEPRKGSLADKVKAPDAVISWLNEITTVASLDQAWSARGGLDDSGSLITPAGEWIGKSWVRVARGQTEQDSMLAREKIIARLRKEVSQLSADASGLSAEITESRDAVKQTESRIQAAQSDVNSLHRKRNEVDGQLESRQSSIKLMTGRQQSVTEESVKLRQQVEQDQAEVRSARGGLEGILSRMAGLKEERDALDAQRSALMARRDQARNGLASARDSRHELALKAESRRASLDSLQQSLERMDTQLSQLQQRYIGLSEQLAKVDQPEQLHAGEMDALLGRRVETETRLASARAHLQGLENEYRDKDGQRQQAIQQCDDIRQGLERARLKQQELELSARAIQRQVDELGEDVAALAESVPEDAESGDWKEKLEQLQLKITRLEPVNLAAIQEFEEEQKRKEYLDAQNDDLCSALTTLENAIAKIDRKTRTRFKETFERVNKGVQELFPRLFGGGHAYLELTGEDLLTTGVSIMAQPPGKRISSLHLLSGGEKALTAVSFVFSIFRLNPAPFCLLDEVDAPLDDANVVRFSTMVREMSESVQFIYVTHNKITMEMAYQMSGVTMREPGVSRLVQVDIDEAARLAAS
ncbi:MAG: chromosome segregation protein SMC [Xanthomonadales bacterium]|nr:chromosome segregation protein SMC [Gammaproteobacteria bacterium]MBT8054391.1 chromosome segregation protein SMC [Gammaproteobacteria bacterium]NND56445.1 chromosome segregation protein SMC [Xanthomonadales bacterium]NNK51140.1 chromosome segregation protein SMC [Xanthomonadales bacterium]